MGNCGSCKTKYTDYFSEELYTWCTNCGNYGIHAALKRALVDENIQPKDVLMCFDIGCNGNGSDKISSYVAHGLHGRVLPFAAGACLANRNVKVFAFGGDGGTLSEGINHLIHCVRCNYDFVFILHNNRNYGLTTGQASATTPADFAMNSSPDGTTADLLEATELVLNLNPSFVARTFSGNVKQTTEVIKSAIRHKGFSFIEILQDCPTYNDATPHEWYLERVYEISKDPKYDSSNLEMAKSVAKSMSDRIATGVLYQDVSKLDFYSKQANREGIPSELVDEVQNTDISKLVEKFR